MSTLTNRRIFWISLVLTLVLALLTVNIITAQDAPAELTFVYRAQPMAELADVEAALNEMLIPRINATVRLVPIDPGAWNDRIRLAVAGGEPMDLVFTANWTNNFYQNVGQGNFLPLDDLLTQYAPGTLASMTPEVWDAARVNGQIYGVPNQILFAQPWGVACRADLLDKYNFDISAVQSYEDMTPFFQAVLDGEEDVAPIYSSDRGDGTVFRTDDYTFELVGSNTGVAIRQDDPTLRAFNVYETEEFRHAAEVAREWYLAGYYTTDPLPVSDAVSAFQAGRYACQLHLMPPGNEVTLRNRFGHEFRQVAITQNLYITTSRVTSNMTAVSSLSAHPDKAVQLIELLNTDLEIYNLLANGIEGRHWQWVDEANRVIGFPEGVTATTSGYNPQTPYLFGNMLNSYIYDPALIGLPEQQMEINRTTTPSVGLGFAPDLSPYSTEIAALSAVISEYVPLLMGRTDPATALPEFQQRLHDAGIDPVLAGLQEQLNAWAASRQ